MDDPQFKDVSAQTTLPPALTITRHFGNGIGLSWTGENYFSQLRVTTEMVGSGRTPDVWEGWLGPSSPFVIGEPLVFDPVANAYKSWLSAGSLNAYKVTAEFLFFREGTKTVATATIVGT